MGDEGPITLELSDCGVNSTQCEGDLIVSLRGMTAAMSVTIGSGNIAWKEVAVKSRARRQVETLYLESETEALLVDAWLTVSKVKLLLVRGGERRVEVSVRCRMVDKFDENALSVALTADCNRRDGLGCTEFGFGIGGGYRLCVIQTICLLNICASLQCHPGNCNSLDVSLSYAVRKCHRTYSW